MFDEICKKVKKAAAKHKIDDFEILLSKGDSTSFDIEQRDITISSVVSNSSLGLRLMKKGKLTYAMITTFDQASLDKVIQAALSNLQPVSLSGFVKIPGGLSSEKIDPRIVDLLDKPKRMRDMLAEMVDNTFAAGKGKFSRLNGGGSVAIGQQWVYTANSEEPSYYRGSAFGASISLDSRDFEFVTGRNLPASSKITSLGTKLLRRLKKNNMKPSDIGVKGKKVDVIVHPICLQSLFNNIVAEHLYASNKLAGLSCLQVGQKLASNGVTIYDDATHTELLSSAPTDQEGTASRKIPIFSKGVFKSFLYDAETAILDNTASTGSGMRRPVLAEDDFEAPVRPSLRALVMEPGSLKLSEMIKGIKKGVFLKMLLGLHTADKVSGEFSNTAYMSYVIENGKLTAAAEPGTWAMKGNALELLSNITAISSERLLTGFALLPWVKTKLYVG